MAYGSTLTDLQSGINNAAQVEANNQAALRDYYARLADIQARRAMATEDVGQRDRAMLANTGVQTRNQDVTQLLGLGQIDASKANVLAEIAARDRALGQQGTQFGENLKYQTERDKQANANAIELAKLRAPDWHSQELILGQAADENDQNAALAAQLNSAIDPLYKAYEDKLNSFEWTSPGSYGKNTAAYDKGLEDTLNASINSIISGASVDPNRVELQTYADANGKLRKRFVPKRVVPNLGQRSPVPSSTSGTSTTGQSPGTLLNRDFTPAPIPPLPPAPPAAQVFTPLPTAAAQAPAPRAASQGWNWDPSTTSAASQIPTRRSSVSLPQPVQPLGGPPGSPEAKRSQFQAAWVQWMRNNMTATPEQRNIAMANLWKQINSQTQSAQ